MAAEVARVVAHLGVFAVMAAATSASLRWADAWGYRDRARTKLVHVASSADPYDTLFFGSSRMRRAVIPEQFDARMRELGQPTRSFNFGIGGMLPHEIDAVLRRVLADESSNLRFVVIELSNHRVEPGEGNWMSGQSVAWHTPEQLLPTLGALAASPRDWTAKARIAWFHVAHTAANAFRVGQGPRLVREWIDPELEPTPAEAWDLEGRGWAAMELNVAPRMIALHAEFLGRREWFEQQAVLAVERGAKPDHDRRFDEPSFRAQLRRVRAAGLEPIFVVLPDLYDRFEPGHERLDELARDAHIVAFNRPSEFASLYRFEHFYDSAHLMSSGAAILTRELAERIASIADQVDAARRLRADTGR